MDGRKHLAVSLAFCIIVFAIPCAAWARIIYVDDAAPAPGDGSSWQTAYRYLQDALTAAESSEKPVEIRLAQGAYKPDRSAAHPQGTGEQSREWCFRVTDDMSLIGGYGGLSGLDPNARDIKAYQTVLSGDLLGNDAPVTDPATLMKDPTRRDNTRIMWVSTNGGHVWLDGCTITGGSGGALVVAGPAGYTDRDVNVTISNCTFRGNRGLWTDTPVAGAVHTIWRGLRLVRCLFEGNAGPMGGAVYAWYPVMDSCQFVGNYASDGGAAYLKHGALTNCGFIQNRAVNGGAVYLDASSSDTATMVGCIFRGNLALGGSGGAIVSRANSDVKDCLFTGNEATGSGGVCFQADSTVILANCVLVGNRAGQDGGAWEAGWRARLKAVNCTLPDNRSPAGSFLMVRHYEQASSTSIIIWNCILPEGSDSIRSTDVPVRLAYTCVGRDGRSLDTTNNSLVWGPGNIEADPCFANPGYWDPNGTPEDPNDDFFVEGDYHLKSQGGRWDPVTESWVMDDVTSPCIDAGDPNSPVGDEPEPNRGRVNMGAYGGTAEASMSYLTEAKVIYVDDDASAPGDGSSWRTAYKYLQDALADAQTADKPVEIRVAQGVYKPDRDAAHPRGGIWSPWTFELHGSMSLRGGFAGIGAPDPNVQDANSCPTILTGDLAGDDCDPNSLFYVSAFGDTAPWEEATRKDNISTVVEILGPGAVLLEGVTVTGGFNSSWGMVASGLPYGECGGGVLVYYDAEALIKDCHITRNYAEELGGGLAVCFADSVRLEDCEISSNTASYGGGLSWMDVTHLEVIRCTLRDNCAWEGGGVGAYGLCTPHTYPGASSALMTGSIVSGNEAFSRAGGLILSYSDDMVSTEITNCVFEGNAASSGIAGILAEDGARLVLRNSIVRNNRRSLVTAAVQMNAYDATLTATYCDIEGGWPGEGNIDVDPLCARAGYWDPNGTPKERWDDFWVDGDYHLKSQAGRWDPVSKGWVQDKVTSPCIDAGDPNSPVGEEPFPNGGRVNMGAYGGTGEASKSYLDGPVGEALIVGGLNGAGRVDLADLQILASH